MATKPAAGKPRKVLRMPAGFTGARRANVIRSLRAIDVKKGLDRFESGFDRAMSERANVLSGGLPTRVNRVRWSIHAPEPTDFVRPHTYVLKADDVEIAHANVVVRNNDGKVELVIEEVQGRLPGQPQHARFVEKAGKDAKTAMFDMVLGAAYDGGFDRVLYKDAKADRNFERPFLLDIQGRPKKRGADEIRSIMKKGFLNLAKRGSLNKREGDYAVRDFP